MIDYTLTKNNLVQDPSSYYAVIRSRGTFTTEDIIHDICRRGSTVSEADVAAVLSLLYVVIFDAVLEGRKVITDIGIFHAGIRGVFTSPDDSFDGVRHTVGTCFSPSTRMRRELASEARVQKKPPMILTPVPIQLLDVATGAVNSLITPGNMAILSGQRLKFDPLNDMEGVFLAGDNGEIRITDVAINHPVQLVFQVPAGLEPGGYLLVVRCKLPGGTKIREGRLDKPLAVPG